MTVKKLSERRKEAEEQLLERIKKSHETEAGGSGKSMDIFRPEAGVKTWYCDPREHLLDIIPYIAGKGHTDPDIKPGDITYYLPLFVHERIGALNAHYVCPARLVGKKCPICEEQKRLLDSGLEWGSEPVQKLEPRKKTIYNIVCYDSDKDEDKGVQVWVAAWFNFERLITELAKCTPRGCGYTNFCDTTKRGKSIAFKREGKKKDDTKYIGHKLVDRDYDIPDDILDSTYCLEEVIHVATYQEIHEVFWASKDTKPTVQEPQEKERERGTPAPAPLSNEEAGGRLRRSRGNVPAEVSVEDTKSKGDVQDPSECPHNHTFGKDIDKMDECTSCDSWDDCAVAADKIEREEKAKRESRRLNKSR